MLITSACINVRRAVSPFAPVPVAQIGISVHKDAATDSVGFIPIESVVRRYGQGAGAHPLYGPQPIFASRSGKAFARGEDGLQTVAGLQAEFAHYRFGQSHSQAVTPLRDPHGCTLGISNRAGQGRGFAPGFRTVFGTGPASRSHPFAVPCEERRGARAFLRARACRRCPLPGQKTRFILKT